MSSDSVEERMLRHIKYIMPQAMYVHLTAMQKNQMCKFK